MKKFTFLYVMLVPAIGFAQPYSIDWSTVDGGGGTSSGGQFSLSGTSGQPDAGPLSGGNYTLEGGFWSVMTAVQTPGAPTLRIRHMGGSVQISWPAAITGYVLEATTALCQTALWSDVSQLPEMIESQRVVTIPRAPGHRFFRLHKP